MKRCATPTRILVIKNSALYPEHRAGASHTACVYVHQGLTSLESWEIISNEISLRVLKTFVCSSTGTLKDLLFLLF